MGRRDAVQFTLEVAAEVMRIDPRMVITWEPNWEKRGNGTSANYEGGLWHHTASESSLAKPFPTQTILRDGRTGLTGPLCNWAGPACTVEAPRLHVMSANPANHAGASGGKSMGPLPVTSLFNPRVYGLEIDYSGVTAMFAGQDHAAKVWGLAVSRVLLRPSCEWIRAHAETSITGKYDIGYAPGKTYDMAAFRRDAWQITDAQGDLSMADAGSLDRLIRENHASMAGLVYVVLDGVNKVAATVQQISSTLNGDLSDGKDRLAEVWERDGLTQAQIAALPTVAQLSALQAALSEQITKTGGTFPPGTAPVPGVPAGLPTVDAIVSGLLAAQGAALVRAAEEAVASPVA